MAHVDEVARIMTEKGFPMEKISFSYKDKNYYNPKDKTFTEEPAAHLKGYKCCLLAISSDKSMDDLKARIRKSEKTLIYIVDQAPEFYPAIRGNIFDFVRAVFIPAPSKKF